MHNEVILTNAREEDYGKKDIWNNMTEDIRNYCFNWSVQKTSGDYIKAGVIAILCFAVLIGVTVAEKGRGFNMVQIAALIIGIAIPVVTYLMNNKFQRTFQGVINHPECEYTVVILEKVDVEDRASKPRTEKSNASKTGEAVYTWLTFLFKDGSKERMEGTVDRKTRIGDNFLVIKRKSNHVFNSNSCFKIPYRVADKDVGI